MYLLFYFCFSEATEVVYPTTDLEKEINRSQASYYGGDTSKFNMSVTLMNTPKR